MVDVIWGKLQPVAQNLRMILPAATLLLVAAAFYGLFRGWRNLRLAAGLAFCAVQLWGYFGFVAAVQAALDRYSLAFEPVSTVFVMLCAAGVLGWVMTLMRRMGRAAVGQLVPAAA